MKNVQDRRIELLLSGRAGIDLNTTKAGCTFADIPAFTKSVGGSPANIVQGAARLGLKTGFLGKVAHDGMGEYILSALQAQNIETKGIVVDKTGARNCNCSNRDHQRRREWRLCNRRGCIPPWNVSIPAGNSRYAIFPHRCKS